MKTDPAQGEVRNLKAPKYHVMRAYWRLHKISATPQILSKP